MLRLADVDPEIAKALREEAQRQHRNLELIASENFVSDAVLEAVGSVLTNKYAEGYPGRRYYGGCEVVDVVADLAIARAKELFGAEHANVQPHSGAQANMAVYFTLLKPGDTVLGPNLSHGGHLTAGSPVNYSGKFYSIVAYGVRKDTERIDLDQVRDLARQHRPKLIIAGGSAFPRAIDFKPFGEIAREVGAALMADIAHPAGLVAAGLTRRPAGWGAPRHAPAARRPGPPGDHRQGRAGGRPPRPDHGEQEHDSVRDQEPHGDERRSARYARRHDARDERVGDGGDRAADRPRAVPPRLRVRRGRRTRRGPGIDGALSPIPRPDQVRGTR